ncbi:hypothetical protein Tco_0704162 [Tanacetum coccineum]|uniref:Uncharacterized protein n=1 Tax=Tanacetum coccineum TaxID=301880 RepID=A0ABQ4Y1D0_9ASTR
MLGQIATYVVKANPGMYFGYTKGDLKVDIEDNLFYMLTISFRTKCFLPGTDLSRNQAYVLFNPRALVIAWWPVVSFFDNLIKANSVDSHHWSVQKTSLYCPLIEISPSCRLSGLCTSSHGIHIISLLSIIVGDDCLRGLGCQASWDSAKMLFFLLLMLDHC